MPPAGEVEQVKEVEAHFQQWQSYAKLVENNYLHHREVYSRLHQFLLGRLSRPFLLLDLGCGDAGFVVQALEGTTISGYVGVDLTKAALALAAKNLAVLRCEYRLMEKDFIEMVQEAGIKADVIWMGLTFHHLPQPQKAKFLRLAHNILPADGYLLMYEPTLLEDETRDQYLARWWRTCKSLWRAMTPAELERSRNHVVNHDFPEKLSILEDIGRKQGFSGMSLLYQDPDKLYAMMCFHTSSAST